MFKPKNLFFTHANCSDGFGAKLAAWWKFKNTALYYDCLYNSDIPKIPDSIEKIWIFDFHFSRKTMEKLASEYKVELWDHHKSAEEELGDLKYCHFDMTQSGAMLAFKRLHPNAAIPRLFDYLQDHDLWENKLPYTHEIKQVIRSLPWDLDAWSEFSIELVTQGVKNIAKRGEDVLNFVNTSVDQLMSKNKVFWVEIQGYKVPCVNTPNWQSEVGNALCSRYPKAKFSVTYFDRSDGQRQFSFRSNTDFDVSEIAKKMNGGGGHRSASGTVVDWQDLDNYIKRCDG